MFLISSASDLDSNDFEESSNRLESILISAQHSSGLEHRVGSAARSGPRKRLLSGSSDKNEVDNELTNDTHDSLLSGQTMMSAAERNEDPDLMIIDFEYCSYNYRGFDMANHFLEYTFDYSNKAYPFFHHHKHQYPTEAQKLKFIATYLETEGKIKDNKNTATNMEGNDNNDSNAEATQLILREVECFTMASHLFWTLWAIVNCCQEIEFGYLVYANCRLGEYFEAKERYLGGHRDLGEPTEKPLRSA